MIKYQRALQILKKNKIRIKTEKVSPLSSVNRISSQNVYSPYNYPAANNTAFDGYAINSSETSKLNKKNIKKFKILKSIAAGDNPLIKKYQNFLQLKL